MSTSGPSGAADLLENFHSLRWVALESMDGPYNDRDFAAGYVAGSIAGLMLTQRELHNSYVIPLDLMAQIDLIAMSLGYRMTAGEIEPGDDFDTVNVSFRREKNDG